MIPSPTAEARWPERELGKARTTLGYHYFPMTWECFLRLRHWAYEDVPKDCAPYLVGGTLRGRIARDLDIALVYPNERWLELCQNYDFDPERGWPNEMEHLRSALHLSCANQVGWDIAIDIKIEPDHWYADRPRVALR